MNQIINSFSNAAIGIHSSILNDIHLPSKNISIYQRDIINLEKELSQLTNQYIECRINGSIEQIKTSLTAYFESHLSFCSLLLQDIFEILTHFEKITSATTYRFLLATIDNDMCRKFHTDINTLRLLCTYIGQGTLWLPDEAINKELLKRRTDRRADKEIIIDETQIQQVNTGDIVILKGALYPQANAIIHRSPTIEKYGEKRVLLRMDTNESLLFE